MSDFWFYFKIGLFHVLDWMAYDHVLFLVVLSVPYVIKDWKKVLALVTAFTVGHCLSLALASYQVVSVNSNVVEFLIPLTILFTALYNVIRPVKQKASKLNLLLILALFFGLIHGFGFSSFFINLTSHLDYKSVPLVYFALGIESAQIIVVLVVLVLSFIAQYLLRISVRDWVLFLSAVVIGLVLPILAGSFVW